MIRLGVLGSTTGTDLQAILDAIDQKIINTKLNEIITILRSIVLQNQSQNIYENKMVNGLKFENNIISFTLELQKT